MTIRTRLLSCALAASLLLPTLSSARSISEIINPSLPTITRAQFISASFEALHLMKTDGSCSLPYTRAPRGLMPTLCAAQDEGVLDIFGLTKAYTLGQNITHGEAIEVLTALLNTQQHDDVTSFKDVKTDREKQAVMNAIALKWMVPARANFFGLSRPLTGSEAVTLLATVSGKEGIATETITISLPSGASDTPLPKQSLLSAVWDIINRDYVRRDKIDMDEIGYKTIEALVNSLNDPYTTFFRPATASDFQSQIKGELSGIGAQIESRSGAIIVVSPLPGSPAERVGIRTGDQILEANGVSLVGLTVEKAVQYIRGERGTTVTLKLRRGGIELSVSVVRDLISIPEIQVSWQGDIAVVQLVQFGETTEKRIRSVFSDISLKHPRGIVLDLRNNGGGLLTAADTVVSNFMPKGTVVAKVQGRSQTTQEFTQDEPTISPSVKLAVLMNKGSASASEIVAGALQDHKRATIIGTQSFGKGTVQEVLGFRDGEALKITIAQWLTPLGRPLDGIGVKPDISVEKTTERDEQLARALEILR